MSTAQTLIKELRQQGIKNRRVLKAIQQVPRERFIPAELAELAYHNQALSIGHEQTISQPYIVAKMSELLVGRERLNNILEIGTGSGYQAAVLAELAEKVYSIERIEGLYVSAKQRLSELGYENIHLYFAEGQLGLPDHAPFAGIIVTAECETIPDAWLEQLAVGGRLVLPLMQKTGTYLCVIEKMAEGHFNQRLFDAVRFVPLKSGLE